MRNSSSHKAAKSIFPLVDLSACLQARQELLHEQESQKATEHMTADGVVTLMMDQACLQYTLHPCESAGIVTPGRQF